MITRVMAIYENGSFKPTTPLALPDGVKVELTVEEVRILHSSATEDEYIQRVESATTLEELFAAMNEAPEDDGYDLCEALNENRRIAGERLLFPPDQKGITW